MFAHKTYLTAARQRMKQMDQALAALAPVGRKVHNHPDAKKLIAELKKHRDAFQVTARRMQDHVQTAEARAKKLRAAGALSWSAFRSAFAKSKKSFAHANRKAAKAVKRAVR